MELGEKPSESVTVIFLILKSKSDTWEMLVRLPKPGTQFTAFYKEAFLCVFFSGHVFLFSID